MFINSIQSCILIWALLGCILCEPDEYRNTVIITLMKIFFFKNMHFFLLKNQLIESKGFICEEHKVETEDGYILIVHRILKKNGTGQYFEKITDF
jgi:hypothetical protein